MSAKSILTGAGVAGCLLLAASQAAAQASAVPVPQGGQPPVPAQEKSVGRKGATQFTISGFVFATKGTRQVLTGFDRFGIPIYRTEEAWTGFYNGNLETGRFISNNVVVK